jgi:hypothetical protein
MIQRCENPKAANWPRYGGKGVTVCDRWHSFEAFLEDMGERPPGMTLDREKGHIGYQPDNCRWATLEQQNANRTLYNATLTHCPRGHAYAGPNLYVKPSGHRVCRCCQADLAKARGARKKTACGVA